MPVFRRSPTRFLVYTAVVACILFALFHQRDQVYHGYNLAQSQFREYYSKGQAKVDSTTGSSAAPDLNGRFDWSKVPVHYPVEEDQLTKLPSDPPQKLPKVQHDFPKPAASAEKVRKERQAAVKATFVRCWNAYKKHAWGHDELAPISGGVKDGFGGWAASLVDNLDNLKIMGLDSEFEDAVQKAMGIDLGKATTETINVFETTIRHLGGFLSAYDLSGDKRLLAKAEEFGEMLIRAFDTPNHLPITRWKPQSYLREKQEADSTVLVAEIGSLEMEFTRLAQVTGKTKYYDAVARIIRLFDVQQQKTYLPGMWPVVVSAKDADFTQNTFFTLSAMSDSLYEYFPKMHALLGGTELLYKKLYEGSMATAIKYNLFRPMVRDNADILLSGAVRVQGSSDSARLQPQGQHLVCFAGGMFALGGKLFNQESHVAIGKKLTDGCIWTYKHGSPLGIMPEVFEMVPCDSVASCTWDEAKWKSAIASKHPEIPPEHLDRFIAREKLPPGFTEISDARYILRPEAIESVFLLYRITGDTKYQEAAWEMFQSITNATETAVANAALSDVRFSAEELRAGNTGGTTQMDSMESFWMAETLKYFYLVFSEVQVVGLDEWVFNTEAHPFRRAVSGAR
ncbi:putative 1,2-alpha-mannosidase [Teratosphaeria nubilosa]|uniref:alpha-1,2-Mannosidase n=1 Tax=Teratosphaeria nubilosa TaxID=161662 RepID=A0A6G1LDS3_9PEZI|nr:putative 1,2-alpha-mannosidase [Teratosphaeria nubilosa]